MMDLIKLYCFLMSKIATPKPASPAPDFRGTKNNKKNSLVKKY